MDYSNLPKGLRVQTQIPLDIKQYSASEATLANLGTNNNLAFTYTKGLIVYCIQEGTRYEWKEMSIGETGLLPVNFTYPANIITFGIDYSNKEYNFVLVDSTIDESNLVHKTLNETITGQKTFTSNVTGSGFVKSGGTSSQYLMADGSVTTLVVPDGSETKVTAGTNVTVTGTGTTINPYIINATSSGVGTSGNYVVTPTGLINISNLNIDNATYLKIGNIVTVNISGTIDITAASITANFGFNLPFTRTTSTIMTPGTGILYDGASVVNMFPVGIQIQGTTSGSCFFHQDSPISLSSFGLVFQYSVE